MTKRIFISTDSNLHGIFGGRNDANLQKKLKESNLSLLNDNDKIYYNGQTFDTSTTTSSIIVVKDSSAARLTGINPNTDFLLHHTQTNEHIKNVVNNFEEMEIKFKEDILIYTILMFSKSSLTTPTMINLTAF